MYYLILTVVVWAPGSSGGSGTPAMQTIEFRDERACRKAALAWKADLDGARAKPDNTARPSAYVLSAVCVASDSTSRIK